MTYFTDNVYERMMMQKPQYGQEQKFPAPACQKSKKTDKPQPYRELIITKKVKPSP